MSLPSLDDIRFCIQTLKQLLKDQSLLDQLSEQERIDLLWITGKLSRPAKEEIRVRNKQIDRARRRQIVQLDREVRSVTGIREARKNPIFTAPQVISNDHHPKRFLQSPRNCYVCKTEYKQLHFFYDSMCLPCADFNYRKRFQTASLKGQVALITGSRLKIGYQATLMMLRAGARVIATTRFPVDAAERFAREPDFTDWKHLLQIHGLDLRHTPSVELFTRFIMQTTDRLDILINNAAQTVRRPPGFYAHLLERERFNLRQINSDAQPLLAAHEDCKSHLTPQKKFPLAWHQSLPGIGLTSSAELSQIPYALDDCLTANDVFPEGKLDCDLQQVDLRVTNSWRLKLSDVSAPEMIEVQLVNAIAPFILCSQLATLMRRDFTGNKHIVNVTAMEGKFYRFTKTDRHPHTNMAKAALNMLTHTSASDLAKDGIYMNAVDTGWVTDEDPAQLSQLKQDLHDFQPPLDIVDGAARVCDPFFDGILTGKHWCGKFLKDYMPTDW